MSSLQSQLNAFRGDVSSAASKVSQKRTVTSQAVAAPSPAPSISSNAGDGGAKRKRPDTPSNIVYSAPAHTGTGQHTMTQITYALEYLKSKEKPVSFKDIFDYLSIKDIDAQQKKTMHSILTNHAKVEHDKNGFGGKGSFRFRPTHNVRSADELLGFLQRQPTAQGISVRELKDGWPGAIDAIDNLELEGKLLVTRNKKDNSAKMVWPNDPSLAQHVDSDFRELWHKIELPPNPNDLRAELIKAGLTPTSQVVEKKQNADKKEKKKKVRRGGKTTNTHMAGILRDYSDRRK